MHVIEHPWSEFLRSPNKVTSVLGENVVVLRRRGAPDLRLSQADLEDERASAFVVFGRTLRNIAAHHPDALAAALVEEFPWIAFLPTKEKKDFVTDFLRTALGASEIDNFAPLTQLIREWRATAEIHADPKLSRRLRRSITTEGPSVQAPSE